MEVSGGRRGGGSTVYTKGELRNGFEFFQQFGGGKHIFFRFSVCWHCWNLHLECHLSNGFDSCLQLGPAIFWSNLVAYFSNFQTTSKLWNVVINVSFLAKENLLVTVEASELLNDKNDSTDSKDKSGSITKALKYVVKGNFELVCFNINTFDFVS